MTEWRSLTDNGWKAVPRTTNIDSSRPLYMADDAIGGRSTLRWGNYWPGMTFRDAEDSETQVVMAPCAVLWILGSQEGGGNLLSSTTTPPGKNEKDCFLRGEGGGASAPIFSNGASDGCRTAEMYVNDKRLSSHAGSFPPVTTETPLNTGLSGGWDFISMRTAPAMRGSTWIDGLAHRNNPNSYADGKQRLAEVVIYTNELTAAECRTAGYYLRIKWNLLDLQRSQTNSAKVVLSENATLDLNGTTNYLASVGGAGLVRNGRLTSAGLVADPSAHLSSENLSFALPAGAVVDVRNFDSLADGVHEIPILTATEFSGLENLGSATFTSSDGSWVPGRGRLSLRFRNGVLYVRIAAGMMLLVL